MWIGRRRSSSYSRRWTEELQQHRFEAREQGDAHDRDKREPFCERTRLAEIRHEPDYVVVVLIVVVSVAVRAVVVMRVVLMVQGMVVSQIVIVSLVHFYGVVLLIRHMSMRVAERRRYDAQTQYETDHVNETRHRPKVYAKTCIGGQ